ncbi:transporter substrate-binding domain-containing protein [Paracoccus sp. N5]|uniref:transporter substrate-binding domain-containing protein n=1 Tax=Paracoccus sp. N5 TaxID=1101189 RepID=UPI00035F406D|nr:transporter substrate-binding domain-containing protein [Paracoccus sp. N5]
MSVTRHLFSLLTAAVIGTTAVAAHANQLEQIQKNGAITVGIDLGQAPFGMVDGQMKEVGSDVETARLLAKDLGVDLKIVSIAPANRIQFLMTNRIDIVVASFSITEERKQMVDFSTPYAVIQAAVATTGGRKVTDLKDLDGQEVAVSRGSTNDQIITKVAEEQGLTGMRIVRYDDTASATNAVVSGQQDYFIVAPSLLAPVNAANPDHRIEPQLVLETFPLGIGLRKNEPEMKAWLDNWVTENLANGKLRDIYKTYHEVDLPDELPAQ